MKIIKLIVVFVTVVMMMVTNHAVNDEDDDSDVWINYNILATAPSKHCGISIVALLSDQCCNKNERFASHPYYSLYIIAFKIYQSS